MKRTILQKAAAAALFVLLTAALLAAADFLLVDDVHSYSRVMLQELYADAGNIDTLFLGSSHCYRSVDPAQVDAALGTHSFNAGSSQQLPDGSYYMLKEAAAQNPLKTVYLEMFYTSRWPAICWPTTWTGAHPTDTPTCRRWAVWRPMPTCCCPRAMALRRRPPCPPFGRPS